MSFIFNFAFPILYIQYKSCLNKLSTPVTSTSKDDKSKYGGDLLDVSEGWLELIMLCQCCGPFQEGIPTCLFITNTSLGGDVV